MIPSAASTTIGGSSRTSSRSLVSLISSILVRAARTRSSLSSTNSSPRLVRSLATLLGYLGVRPIRAGSRFGLTRALREAPLRTRLPSGTVPQGTRHVALLQSPTSACSEDEVSRCAILGGKLVLAENERELSRLQDPEAVGQDQAGTTFTSGKPDRACS